MVFFLKVSYSGFGELLECSLTRKEHFWATSASNDLDCLPTEQLDLCKCVLNIAMILSNFLLIVSELEENLLILSPPRDPVTSFI